MYLDIKNNLHHNNNHKIKIIFKKPIKKGWI